MQLKIKNGKVWDLIPMSGEIKPEELKPYESVMKLYKIDVLKIGERVRVPFVKTQTKKKILQWLQSLEDNRLCENCGEPRKYHVGTRRLCKNPTKISDKAITMFNEAKDALENK